MLVVKTGEIVVNGKSQVIIKTKKGVEHGGINTFYRSDLNLLTGFQDLFYAFRDILKMVFAHSIGSSANGI